MGVMIPPDALENSARGDERGGVVAKRCIDVEGDATLAGAGVVGG